MRNYGRELIICILMTVVCLSPCEGKGEDAVKLKETAEKTVETDVHIQETAKSWLEEERQLMDEIEDVQSRLKRVRWQLQKNETYRENLEEKVRELNLRAREMEKINEELSYVLEETLGRLEVVMEGDLPYNRVERKKRFIQAKRILNDYDMSLLQKTRAVLDAVAGETDIGHTVDVLDAEIEVDGLAKRVKMLRVGRLGLYALTMDAQDAYLWNMEDKRWVVLEDGQRSIEEAMEMAEGTRIIGFSKLPMDSVQTLEAAGGENHESN